MTKERGNSMTIPLVKTDLPIDQLHAAFAESSNGQVLKERVRYERYKPSQMSNEAWVNLLGADVNNLDHMPATNQLTATFLRMCDVPTKSWKRPVSKEATFSLEDRQTLRLAAMMHDQVESLPKHHDISFDLKTDTDESAEWVAMKELVKEEATMLGLPKEDETALVDKMHSVTDTVLEDRNSKLGKAFNAIERLGYMRTGVRAWELAGKQKIEESEELEDRGETNQDKELKGSLQWLSSNVLGNQIPKLLEYAETYPPIHAFLEGRAEQITEALHAMPVEVFNNYKEAERQGQIDKFAKAREAWFASSYAPQTPVAQTS